ncbi:MAG: N-6 DNA methylase [Candidatus Parvarchaeota archaeon]
MNDNLIASYDASCMKKIDIKRRKELGQYPTPYKIAQFMVDIAIFNRSSPTVLDPSVGCGIFLDLITDRLLSCYNDNPSEIVGFDVDKAMVETTRIRLLEKQYTNSKIIIHNADFLLSEIHQKFDVIICNPPYVKSNRILNKTAYLTYLNQKFNYQINGKTGLDGFFLLKAVKLLNEDGTLVFITPSEFLNSGYGTDIKRYLLKDLKIDALIYLDTNSFIFEDGMSSALITVAHKSKDSQNLHKIKFIKLKEIDALNRISPTLDIDNSQMDISVQEYLQKELDPAEKWLPKFSFNNGNRGKQASYIKLKDLFVVHRGIATGANKFFTLSPEEAKYWNIPEKYLQPVICKASYASLPAFTQSNYSQLSKSGKKTLLLSINEENPEGVDDYLQYGLKMGVDKTFLNSRRKKWFFIENREPPQLFAKVFRRDGFVFILNTANVKNLTCFHGLYPKVNDIRISKALILYSLTSKGQLAIQEQTRKYAGGLNKLEPKDIENILIPNFSNFSDDDLEMINRFFDENQFLKYSKLKDKTEKAFSILFDKTAKDNEILEIA